MLNIASIAQGLLSYLLRLTLLRLNRTHRISAVLVVFWDANLLCIYDHRAIPQYVNASVRIGIYEYAVPISRWLKG